MPISRSPRSPTNPRAEANRRPGQFICWGNCSSQNVHTLRRASTELVEVKPLIRGASALFVEYYPFAMQRSTAVTVEISLAKLRENVRAIARQTGVDIYAVVKADGYGFGAARIAEAIKDLVHGYY